MKNWYWEKGSEAINTWFCHECAADLTPLGASAQDGLELHQDQDIPCTGCWDDPMQTLTAQFAQARKEIEKTELGSAIETVKQLLKARTTEEEKQALITVLGAAGRYQLLELSGTINPLANFATNEFYKRVVPGQA